MREPDTRIWKLNTKYTGAPCGYQGRRGLTEPPILKAPVIHAGDEKIAAREARRLSTTTRTNWYVFNCGTLVWRTLTTESR